MKAPLWILAVWAGLNSIAAFADSVVLNNGDRLSGTVLTLEADALLLSLESLQDYLYQSRTGFRVPIGNGLSFGTQVNFDYDAVPTAGKGSTDTAVNFKLGYTL